MRNLFGFQLRLVRAPEEGGGQASGAGGSAPAAPGGATAGSAGTTPAAGGGTGAPGGASATPAASVPVAFADSLPEDIRADASLRDIKDLAGLARSYVNGQKLLGRQGQDPTSLVAIPKAEDADAWSALYDRLGRPKDTAGYKLTDPTLPQGTVIDTQLRDGYLSAAHAAGMTNQQADALFKWYNETYATRATAESEAVASRRAQADQALRKDWGTAYDQNLGLARDALQHYGSNIAPGIMDELEATGLGNLPALAKLFAALGKNLAEDGALTGRNSGSASVLSPTEAKQQINTKMADRDFVKVYTDKKAPGHAEAVLAMEQLYKLASPPS